MTVFAFFTYLLTSYCRGALSPSPVHLALVLVLGTNIGLAVLF